MASILWVVYFDMHIQILFPILVANSCPISKGLIYNLNFKTTQLYIFNYSNLKILTFLKVKLLILHGNTN